MVDFSKVAVGFTATDLVGSAMSIMTQYKEFILAGLAVVFAPKLFGLARAALAARGSKA
ncbi:hypothetical protein ACTFRD_31850 [Bacillus cereus group sp. MYBK249-1]|uniref:Uncharacterized protein n=1 Tax=Bacillus cereus TIAC219 TaxID=718222 RepID=A0ABC9SP69_BACCE|nr:MULTISPECIES: hypothetical protein [Bacillus cereus group]MCU5121276.1 hypothetical protein [Bacillus cereus]EJP81012.1 hypothetical protein IC1_06738 [Bacillus cereus VD022]EOQ55294.1 hypothetical protein IAY_06758 [Bacillus cereus TIAC219]MDA2074576.1 hypothetical protein [Bacillus cereus]MDA2440851.1 hypothetical protein [Bacillus cereus]